MYLLVYWSQLFVHLFCTKLECSVPSSETCNECVWFFPFLICGVPSLKIMEETSTKWLSNKYLIVSLKKKKQINKNSSFLHWCNVIMKYLGYLFFETQLFISFMAGLCLYINGDFTFSRWHNWAFHWRNWSVRKEDLYLLLYSHLG